MENSWTCSNGKKIEIIEKKIGGGGQATVHKVKFEDKLCALKVYRKDFIEKLGKEAIKQRLNKLITKKGVDKTIDLTAFVLPLFIYEHEDELGYVMELLPEEYVSADKIVDVTDFQFRFTVCIKLSQAFHNLHSAGFSYKDISANNVYVNTKTGDVKIIDSDNISSDFQTSGIKGTEDFMAPELRDEKRKAQPSVTTDLYSMAVLLFLLLFKWKYPRVSTVGGDCRDYSAKFIYEDESDLDKYSKNDDDKVRAQCWNAFPKFLKDLFTKTFTEGIKNPESRPKASDWLDAFIRLKGISYKCPSCNDINFLDKEDYESKGLRLICECGSEVKKPVMQTSGKGYIVLEDSDIIYQGFFKDFEGDKSAPAFSVNLTDKLLCLNCCSVGVREKVGTSVLRCFMGREDVIKIGRHEYKIKYPY